MTGTTQARKGTTVAADLPASTDVYRTHLVRATYVTAQSYDEDTGCMQEDATETRYLLLTSNTVEDIGVWEAESEGMAHYEVLADLRYAEEVPRLVLALQEAVAEMVAGGVLRRRPVCGYCATPVPEGDDINYCARCGHSIENAVPPAVQGD
jgi:hypothetical protein